MFILKEIINYDINLIGIEADTYYEAVEILKLRLLDTPEAKIYEETLDVTKYKMLNNVMGILENKPLKILDTNGKLIEPPY